MKYTNKLTILSIVILFSLISSLLFPTGVLADDTTPPPPDTSDVSVTQEPVATDEPVATEEPTLVATQEPVATDEPVATEEPTLDEASPVPTATEEPVIDESVPPAIPDSLTPIPEEEPAADEPTNMDVAEVVQAAAENNIMLADPTGEPLSLATVDATETLSTGDPYFTSGGVLYNFTFADCNPVLNGAQPCSTPIQAALTFSETHPPDLLVAPDGALRQTIFVQPGVYNEQLTINLGGLTLWGDPGSMTSPGAAASAPVLDGSLWASGDVGVTINAEGVTLIGFIIQNYATAVFQPVVVGGNSVTITQNTIQNNGNGILIHSNQGSPGTDATYNILQNNSGFDLVNGDPGENNVQYVDAPNNYWGCAGGPVVAYRIFVKENGKDVWTGQWGYIDWATKHNYGINGNGDDPDANCAVLYGADSLFDHQLNTTSYSPYKINIGTFADHVGTPALSLVKVATPTTYSTVGQAITYSYVVTNTGDVTLNGPFTVNDNKTTVTCPAGGLAPGASLTCTATYTITQADLNSGSVTNTATASANGTNSNQDSETVTAVQSSALTINKTASPATYSAVGQVINYSYVVTNAGNVTLSGPFTVNDDKAAATCPVGGLAPGASLTCTATYTITQADLDLGSVTNVASATNGTVTSPTDSETVTAVQSTAISLVKTATPGTYDAVGDVITYSYVVTNNSNVTLNGPFTVTDDKAAAACPAGGLAPGASLTCTATYIITQADLDAGSVTNIAFATNGTVTSLTDTETVTAVQNAALTINKTASPTTYSIVGQVINYSYIVTNAGNVNLNGPFTVNDDKATVTCPAGGLAPGASLTCSATYTITQADLDSGSVTNIASATNGTVTSPTDTETVTASQSPVLTINKIATPTTYSAVGQVINYSYIVTNAGNVTLNGPFTVNDDKATVTCPAGGLAPGASLTCTAAYTITQAHLDAGSVTNVASATNGTVTSPTDTETVTAVRSPALTIVKTASPTTYAVVGQVINYSYLVTNTGNVTLNGPFAVNDNKASVTCPAGGLAPGASLTCTATYTITQADLDAGSVTNIASATDGTVTSPTDTETVTAIQSSALSLVKTATPGTYDAVGDIINYSYLVTNTGNITLNGPFTVNDNKAAATCPAGGLAPGISLTCTATYIITQADLDAGFVINIAFATNGIVTSPIDTETVTAIQNAALSLVKTATPTTYSIVGQVITYSYVVTNNSNVTLNGPFTVNDDKATVTCPAGGLAPGASLTCTATYTITQADLNSGFVINIASATNGTVTSPTDTETVTAVQSPALTINKTATPNTYDSVGDVISYSYVVTNTGNVTLSGPFTVNDDKSTDESCPAMASLAPGASITCTATYTIIQADLDAGSVTNTAFATNGAVTSAIDTETVTAVQSSTLSLDKTATPTIYSAVGQVINYSYVVTNTGNVTLAGPVTVTDDKATVTCPAGGLVPGASLTCTATYIITQADLNSGSVTNIAGAFANQTESNQDSETVTALRNPSQTTVKTETSTGPYVVGDTITYTIAVSNTGNVTLTGVTATDNNAVLGTCTPAQPSTLLPGASMTCSASHVVTQANVTSGSYTNTGTGDSDQTPPDTSTVKVNFKPPTSPTPRPSVAFTGFIPVTAGETHAIAAGIAHTCAITPEGGVQCWGNNDFGQLGNGTNAGSNVRVDVLGLGGGTTIVAGGNHTCVLSGSDVWCWGQNSKGQIGDGTTTDRNSPVKVLGNVSDITAGLDYTCAIMVYGQVMCWGNNDQGQLANGITSNSPVPTLATLITGISNVDAGQNKSCGLTASGLLRCMRGSQSQDLGKLPAGDSQSSEIGLDVAVNRFGPAVVALNGDGVPLTFLSGRFRTISDVDHAKDVDSGLGHFCALLSDGTVKCWGSNYYGQLGINSQVNSSAPQSVLNVSGAWQLAVGKYHACVMLTSTNPGTDDIQCWGLNTDGQLGNGTNENSLIPVFVK